MRYLLIGWLIFAWATAFAQNTPFEARTYVSPQGDTLRYRLLLPSNYQPNKQYPLVIFLHGSGERGHDNTAQLVHGTWRFADDAARKDFPCVVMVPQCPKDQTWSTLSRDTTTWRVPMPDQPTRPMQLVMENLADLQKKYSIDARRIYITGLSMGGFGTMDALIRYPDTFAAAAVVCGGGDWTKITPQLKNKPIWLFHGTADRVVQLGYSQKLRTVLGAVKAKVRYTEYAGVGHDCWTPAYREQDLLKWLFAKKLK
jgi:predicted peptidase